MIGGDRLKTLEPKLRCTQINSDQGTNSEENLSIRVKPTSSSLWDDNSNFWHNALAVDRVKLEKFLALSSLSNQSSCLSLWIHSKLLQRLQSTSHSHRVTASFQSAESSSTKDSTLLSSLADSSAQVSRRPAGRYDSNKLQAKVAPKLPSNLPHSWSKYSGFFGQSCLRSR